VKNPSVSAFRFLPFSVLSLVLSTRWTVTSHFADQNGTAEAKIGTALFSVTKEYSTSPA
jgi:hypothetical protein